MPAVQPDIELELLGKDTLDLYCRMGEQSYRENYLHLWPNQDPSPYLLKNFTQKNTAMDIEDTDNIHYLIRVQGEYIGVAKLVKNRIRPDIDLVQPVFLEKIYLLKAFTGMGYGQQVLLALHTLAKNKGLRSIYLVTMKKGRALNFYKKLGYQILREEILPFENAVPNERGMFLLGRSLE